ncbi:BPTI/Kunitz domain-containing protein [Candidatus Pacearchaeota archaeon]|nr:BPTI/Kunitz domain-containing protein [Candidatus Pacearchaeota archaeon]
MKKGRVILVIIILIVIIVGIFYFTGDGFRCSLEPESGTCKAIFERYYFDSSENICKQFIWGGCGGVVPFKTIEDCQKVCES